MTIGAFACLLVTGCGILSEVEIVLDKKTKAPTSSPVKIEREPDELLAPTLDELDAWSVAPAPPFAPRGAAVTKYLPKGKLRFWGAHVSAEANRAVVTFTGEKTDIGRRTVALMCNVANGKAVARWEVPEMSSTHAIHPSGNLVLMGRANGVRSHRERLCLCKVSTDGRVSSKNWSPLVPETEEDPKLFVKEYEIRWAEFVGNDWIVTLNNAGKLYVWNLEDLSRYAMIRGIVGEPTLTPDASRVMFLQGDSLCVFDPRKRAIVGTRRIDEIPEDAQLAIHPSAKFIAIAGEGQTTVMHFESGRQVQLMMKALRPSKGRRLKSDLGWIGNFIFSQRSLYDFDSPIAVWDFDRTEWGKPIGNSYWAVVRPKRTKQYLIRSFNVPHQAIAKKVKAALQSSDVLALRPGDPVRVDVAALPQERQSEIASTLHSRLKEQGYRISNKAAVSVVARLDDEPKEMTVRYYILEGMQVLPSRDSEWLDMSYERRRAWLEFERDGNVLWSVSGWHSPPSHVKFSREESRSGTAGEAFGTPDYSIYSERRLPEYLRAHRAKKIGSTRFHANGMTHR